MLKKKSRNCKKIKKFKTDNKYQFNYNSFFLGEKRKRAQLKYYFFLTTSFLSLQLKKKQIKFNNFFKKLFILFFVNSKKHFNKFLFNKKLKNWKNVKKKKLNYRLKKKKRKIKKMKKLINKKLLKKKIKKKVLIKSSFNYLSKYIYYKKIVKILLKRRVNFHITFKSIILRLKNKYRKTKYYRRFLKKLRKLNKISERLRKYEHIRLKTIQKLTKFPKYKINSTKNFSTNSSIKSFNYYNNNVFNFIKTKILLLKKRKLKKLFNNLSVKEEKKHNKKEKTNFLLSYIKKQKSEIQEKKEIKKSLKPKFIKLFKMRRDFKSFKYFINESRKIVKKYNKKRKKKKKSIIFWLKYRLLKIATKNINYIRIKLKIKNIFISFYRRVKGLFIKATCGIFGFTGAKKSTTFAYEHTALNIGRNYYKKKYVLFKYKNIRDKISGKRKKRKVCIVSYFKTPLFFNLQHHLHRRQIRSIIRGFKKSNLGITFLSYNPKTAHNGLWLRKKKRV